MIWGVLIFLFALAGKLFFDVKLYRNGKFLANHHSSGPVIVLGLMAGAIWLSGRESAGMYLFGFWAIFDTLYALLIGQKWYYVGQTAFLDRLQRRFRVIQVFKYLLFIASIIFYVRFK